MKQLLLFLFASLACLSFAHAQAGYNGPPLQGLPVEETSSQDLLDSEMDHHNLERLRAGLPSLEFASFDQSEMQAWQIMPAEPHYFREIEMEYLRLAGLNAQRQEVVETVLLLVDEPALWAALDDPELEGAGAIISQAEAHRSSELLLAEQQLLSLNLALDFQHRDLLAWEAAAEFDDQAEKDYAEGLDWLIEPHQ